ncbi:unnamed protein product [Fusarium graminearum]|uniref:Chromosome 2, complete genome n=1 Tax=Gibberella zeae (strain ATCC MYA-4620 / CBS 123657 / FGSC 9075 / NRRL 31084 / PH-1) TaxID=229533 RepID=A0A098DHE4_GIBZE|nr:unnamed protein product [Fusarium graminearum]CZS81692.1 unnamed protein product [Fusarium graminearum]
MIIAPQKTPAAPSPAMALPMMNTGELGAAAHSMEPASKIIDEARYTHFKFQKVYILPNAGWAESWYLRTDITKTVELACYLWDCSRCVV